MLTELEAQRYPGSKILQIRLNDISRGVLALLLEFVYTDSVRAPPQMALELVHVTKKYLPDRHMRLVHQVCAMSVRLQQSSKPRLDYSRCRAQ